MEALIQFEPLTDVFKHSVTLRSIDFLYDCLIPLVRNILLEIVLFCGVRGLSLLPLCKLLDNWMAYKKTCRNLFRKGSLWSTLFFRSLLRLLGTKLYGLLLELRYICCKIVKHCIGHDFCHPFLSSAHPIANRSKVLSQSLSVTSTLAKEGDEFILSSYEVFWTKHEKRHWITCLPHYSK